MARIKGLSDEEAGFVTRAIFRSAKKMVGQVPDPLRIQARNGAVMWAAGGFEMGLRSAKSVDPKLKAMASIKVASMVGCVF